MSTLALESQGTLFQVFITTDSPPAFATVGQVKAINGPSGNATVIDVSDLNSVMKEKRIGLPDWGNISLDMFFVPKDTGLQYIKDSYFARTRQQFQIVFTDSPATNWTFYGYVSHVGVTMGVDQPVNGTINVEIDGDITET